MTNSSPGVPPIPRRWDTPALSSLSNTSPGGSCVRPRPADQRLRGLRRQRRRATEAARRSLSSSSTSTHPSTPARSRRRTQIKTTRRSENGDRAGFGGQSYETIKAGHTSYADLFDDYLAFLEPRLEEARSAARRTTGRLYFHIDYREVHYCKVLLDEIFGRDCFLNEIIWAYDYGGRPKNRWPPKHDNILLYVKDPAHYTFNYDAIERIPYMAPGLVGPEKAARGKLPTDIWWHTIVPTNGKEKTGYPTQKPLGFIRRIVQASSGPGDLVLDFFAGSGTTGAVARQQGRRFVLVDDNPEALSVMQHRLGSGGVSYLNSKGEPIPGAGGRAGSAFLTVLSVIAWRVLASTKSATA